MKQGGGPAGRETLQGEHLGEGGGIDGAAAGGGPDTTESGAARVAYPPLGGASAHCTSWCSTAVQGVLFI